MRKRDLSLVFFTVLSQWSIGIMLWLTVLTLLAGEARIQAQTGPSPANPVLLALLLVALATTLSFLHLGKPVNAPKAVRNLATSWLSREILAIGLYSLCLLIALVHGWQTNAPGFAWYLLAPALVAGLFLLWTMTGVYLIATVAPWNSAHTPLGFTLTTLCLGAISCLAFGMAGHVDIDARLLDLCGGMLVAVLILEAVAGQANQLRLRHMDSGVKGPSFGHGPMQALFRARMAMLLVASLGVALLLLDTGPAFGPEPSSWVYAVLALVGLQEFAGRLQFYASYFRVGM